MNPRQRGRRRDERPADLPLDVAAGADPYAIPANRIEVDAEPVLVSDEELEKIRWASYDAAVADAKEHRNRALDAAAERLDSKIRAAHREYGQAQDAADAAYDATRRAAMQAHQLAQAGQPVPA